MKVLKEWFVEAPWGRIALISCGNPNGPPVLMVHGRADSAATFLPLLELVPDSYHYVGIDLPGHGRSEAFPIGVALTRFFGVIVVDVVIRHLAWTEFIYFGHSMGVEIGLFYNAIYPGQIKKFVLLDPGPALQRLMIRDFQTLYSLYDSYYSNYKKCNTHDKSYTKSDAIRAVMKARNMTEGQAEVILSRNLWKIGEDQYRLSWDRRTNLLIPMNCPPEYYYELFSKNCPPTLYISAKHSSISSYAPGKVVVNKLVSDLEKSVQNFIVLRVDGDHDVHFTNPERFSEQVCKFINKKFGDIPSKL